MQYFPRFQTIHGLGWRHQDCYTACLSHIGSNCTWNWKAEFHLGCMRSSSQSHILSRSHSNETRHLEKNPGGIESISNTVNLMFEKILFSKITFFFMKMMVCLDIYINERYKYIFLYPDIDKDNSWKPLYYTNVSLYSIIFYLNADGIQISHIQIPETFGYQTLK